MSDRDTTPLFDLFLVRGLKEGKSATDSLGTMPLAPEVRRIIQRSVTHTPPGLVPVALPRRLAWEAMWRLGAVGATGDIVEVAYRAPRISPEMARGIAEQALANELAKGRSHYTYEPLQLRTSLTHGSARWWTFFARSPEAQEEGYVPGGATIYVDKVDGHCWTREELNVIGLEWDRLIYLFPNWREGIYGEPPWQL